MVEGAGAIVVAGGFGGTVESITDGGAMIGGAPGFTGGTGATSKSGTVGLGGIAGRSAAGKYVHTATSPIP